VLQPNLARRFFVVGVKGSGKQDHWSPAEFRMLLDDSTNLVTFFPGI
jgi:hypothetical protein